VLRVKIGCETSVLTRARMSTTSFPILYKISFFLWYSQCRLQH